MDDEDVANMVEELCDLESGLTEWEANFVEDMSKRTTFTEKQAAKVKDIYREKVEGEGR